MASPASEIKTIAVADVVFREDLYPRSELVPHLVQTYMEVIERLPPIEINQDNILIDGRHRQVAHVKAGVETIQVRVTYTANEMELLELAIRRNAEFGQQLSMADKQRLTREMYSRTPPEEQGPMKTRLADLFAVTERSIQNWTSRIDKDNKEARDAAVFNLWLACHTLEEIAERVGISHQAISLLLQADEPFRLLAKPGLFAEIEDEAERLIEIERANRAAAEHKTEFKPPIYNVWKQQDKTPGAEHFGNSEVRWLDNLLYLYTAPFDVVVDPFAGSGSTRDVCISRLRRYWISDRKPAVEFAGFVREHDIGKSLPRLPWSEVGLVYLDPPYWKQAEGQYSDDPEDLANMPLNEFHKKMAAIITAFSKKNLRSGAVIAMLMQPTQWAAPEHEYTDHIIEICRRVALPLDMRISAPYESQQCNAQMVEWAKSNRRCLVLSRELVVWKVQ